MILALCVCVCLYVHDFVYIGVCIVALSHDSSFFLHNSAVSDDMLPSDIEVVIREGYHVSQRVVLPLVINTQHCYVGVYTVLYHVFNTAIHVILGSVVVSISARRVEDPGLIPGRRVQPFFFPYFICANLKVD